MPVLALGVSYRMASVDLLERLTLSDDREAKAYRRLADLDSVQEAVLLSTCNRVEVYAEVQAYHPGFQELKRFLSEATDVAAEDLAGPLYSHYEEHAAEHLFSVAAGLDSMVLGEPQVLSQVRAALRRADEEGLVGSELRPLFSRAVRAGRRVRAETGIGASPSAFVDAALVLAREHLGELRGRTAVVIGAGEMAGLAAAAVVDLGLDPVVVLSRRRERAERVAAQVGGVGGTLEELDEALSAADVVVCSTGSTLPVISTTVLEDAVRHRELFVIDLAVPRDVDPDAAAIPGVRLVDIDDLAPAVSERSGQGDQEMASALEIVRDEVRRSTADRRAQRLAPLIRALHEAGEAVRAEELERLAPRLKGLDARDREAVDALTRRIVARLLHEPTVRLKDLAASRRDGSAARVLAELFGIAPEE